MNFQIRESIVDALEIIAANCNQKINDYDNLVRAWHIGLKNFSDEQIEHGMERVLEKPEGFLPTVGEFKQYTSSSSCGSSLDSEAEIIWGRIVANLNYYVSPIFKNSAIAEAIRQMGGWKQLCSMQRSEEPFRKKDFISLYMSLKTRNLDYNPVLIGSGDIRQYRALGWRTEEQAQKVIEEVKLLDQVEGSNNKNLLEMYSKKLEKSNEKY